jgi:hypothetical protein
MQMNAQAASGLFLQGQLLERRCLILKIDTINPIFLYT